MLPPWERQWLRITPEDFERMVVEHLRRLGHPLMAFAIEYQAKVSGPDGEFAMDAKATFEALGARFVVLVECKHHRRPVERELVQVLADKVASTRSHKGMLFATGGFQRGAIEYASSRQVALVHFTEGGPVYETKSRYSPPVPNRPYEGHWVTWANGGFSYRWGAHEELRQMIFDSDAA
jgi:restriction system protein